MVTATPHEDLEAYFADREADDCRYCSGSGEREMSDTTSGPDCHTELVSCPYCQGTGARMDCLPVPTDRHQGWPGVYAVLYTDEINGEQACRDDLWMATSKAIRCVVEKAQTNAYAEGRKDEAEAMTHRGYVLFGAGAYLLAICAGDERGPELVAYLATEDEKVGRTVGDLGEPRNPGQEIQLERVAVRLQFASERGLFALEQQLRMLREQHFASVAEGD